MIIQPINSVSLIDKATAILASNDELAKAALVNEVTVLYDRLKAAGDQRKPQYSKPRPR
jgi:hypothetical protein